MNRRDATPKCGRDPQRSAFRMILGFVASAGASFAGPADQG